MKTKNIFGLIVERDAIARKYGENHFMIERINLLIIEINSYRVMTSNRGKK